MRYELTDLKVFLAIAAARSLSGGAADMHLTAPSASYRLKNLEQAMGAPLFERTPKGMALTPAGLTVKRYADSILGNVERLNEEMKRHTDGVAGHIRVFANSSTLNALMPTYSSKTAPPMAATGAACAAMSPVTAVTSIAAAFAAAAPARPDRATSERLMVFCISVFLIGS